MLLEIVTYVLAYLIFSFLVGIALGKMIRRGREGYGDDND